MILFEFRIQKRFDMNSSEYSQRVKFLEELGIPKPKGIYFAKNFYQSAMIVGDGLERNGFIYLGEKAFIIYREVENTIDGERSYDRVLRFIPYSEIACVSVKDIRQTKKSYYYITLVFKHAIDDGAEVIQLDVPHDFGVGQFMCRFTSECYSYRSTQTKQIS